MAFCEFVKTIRLPGGKTAKKPCALKFRHRHMVGGKPLTRDFVTAKPVKPEAVPAAIVEPASEGN